MNDSKRDKFNDNEQYLLSFCNQAASPLHSLAVVDLKRCDMTWIELDFLPNDILATIFGICGACPVGDDQIVVCTQNDGRPSLLLVDTLSASIKTYRALESVTDAHSLAHDGSHIYVVSTGTNEIYRSKLIDGEFREEELHWRFPDVGSENDEVHLNGITMDGHRLIACCFGKRREDQGWGKEGRVFYIDSDEVILTGLDQPHTPFISEGMLAIAESGAGRVHLLERENGGRWNPSQIFDVGGYTRGLDIYGGFLYVGVSSTRKVSRSKKVLVDGRKNDSATRVAVYDMKTGRKDVQYELSLLGREIYDMVRIDKGVGLRTVMDGMDSRIQEIERAIDRYMTLLQEANRERATHQDALHRTQEKLNRTLEKLNRTQAELNRTLERRISRFLGKIKMRN